MNTTEYQTEETMPTSWSHQYQAGRVSRQDASRCDCWVCGCILQKKNIGTRKDKYRKTTARIMNFIAELELAGHKVDMMIIQRGTGKHSPMRMESCARDRR